MPETKERPAAAPAVRPHGYAAILVHAEPGLASTHRVEVAARLACAFDARLIGLGAETIDAAPAADPFMGYITTEWVALAQQQVQADLEKAEEAFRRDAAGAEAEWRAVQDFPARALARAARAADLIVTSAAGGGAGSGFRRADTADVVMASGRPVLVVPEGRGHLRAERIVVAWKDAREARRAVADAMPFLKRAEAVIVQAVCSGDEVESAAFQTEDVAASLRRHGVRAQAHVTTAAEDGVTAELERIGSLNDADLIVAGAYGHSRLAEWAFGGVTRDLLSKPRQFVLLSH